jgi:hypothetical protein
MTPLDYFVDKWTSDVPTIPLITVVNAHVDLAELTAPWAGVMVNPDTYRLATMGSKPYREEVGTYTVGLFFPSGTGQKVPDDTARAVREVFQDWRTSDGKLTVGTINGPLDIDPEADGEWYRLALELQYVMWSAAP